MVLSFHQAVPFYMSSIQIPTAILFKVQTLPVWIFGTNTTWWTFEAWFQIGLRDMSETEPVDWRNSLNPETTYSGDLKTGHTKSRTIWIPTFFSSCLQMDYTFKNGTNCPVFEWLKENGCQPFRNWTILSSLWMVKRSGSLKQHL